MALSSPHIVVIGAGLIGLSTADRLQDGGAQVTVIDARPGPVRGASHANSGMIHPSQFRSWGAPSCVSEPAERSAAEQAVLELARASRERLLARMDALGLGASLARPRGCYQIHPDIMAARLAQADLAKSGVRANVVVDPQRTLGRPALFFPDDRSADARLYGEALAEDLAARGVTLIYDAPDVRLRRNDGPEGRIAVALSGHRFQADHAVVACGAQSAELLASLGLSIRIKAVRGWAVDFDPPNDAALSPVPIMDTQSRSALTVFEKRFRLSGTWGEDSARPLLARWAELMPDVLAAAGNPRSVWSGLRPVSEAERPFIGPAPIPGLWVNAGHGHLGWTLCAGSGELMARMILDDWQDPRFAFAG